MMRVDATGATGDGWDRPDRDSAASADDDDGDSDAGGGATRDEGGGVGVDHLRDSLSGGSLSERIFEIRPNSDAMNDLQAWHVTHTIDRSSPIYHVVQDGLGPQGGRLVGVDVSLTAYDTSCQQEVKLYASYSKEELVSDAKFDAMETLKDGGRAVVIDHAKLDAYSLQARASPPSPPSPPPRLPPRPSPPAGVTRSPTPRDAGPRRPRAGGAAAPPVAHAPVVVGASQEDAQHRRGRAHALALELVEVARLDRSGSGRRAARMRGRAGRRHRRREQSEQPVLEGDAVRQRRPHGLDRLVREALHRRARGARRGARMDIRRQARLVARQPGDAPRLEARLDRLDLGLEPDTRAGGRPADSLLDACAAADGLLDVSGLGRARRPGGRTDE